ncbi:MAG: hypothetical protein HY761_10100 [Candidatus Omnitrophica bacterium]|nr:hypothetical protein [Candidatus Omnitrophota bacterium]
MTKQELLAEMKAKEFIGSVEEPKLLEVKPDGAKWYQVNVREVVGKAAIYRNMDFYVVDEGKDTESAYYKDSEPSQSIKAIEII